MSYQLATGSSILRLADSATIPTDPRNSDYQTYLQWLAAGNTPLPAVTPPTPIPPPDYQLLYDRILGSDIYQLIRTAAASSTQLALACLEFIAAMGDAKAGRPNVAALNACITNLLLLANLTPEQKDTLRGFISEANLKSVYIIPE
jgi:hypothetical protein